MSDPGNDAVQSYTVNWGDGLYDVYTPEQIAQNNQVTHTYSAAPGTANITVDLTDDGGTYSNVAASFPVDVNPFLPSVDELTMDAGLPNKFHIANFGTTITNAGLSITPSEGLYNISASYVDDAGNGILDWSPDGSTQPGDYTLLVSAAYNSLSWSKSITVHVVSQDMPPVFPCHDMAVSNYSGSISFAACDKEDATLNYSITLDPSSPDLPADAQIDSYGNFTCTFSGNDAYKIYEFDVTATDSANQSDTMHVVMSAVVSYSNTPSVVANAYTSVDVNSTPIQLSLGADEQIENGNPYFYIDELPSHGSLDNTEGTDGYVNYTPDTNFRGLDTFTYHWEYDRHDYSYPYGIIGRATTNIAHEYVQVGQFCDLMVDGMPVVDGKYVLGAGQTKTIMLTLDNPRGDGVPATGKWSVSYDPKVMKVSCGGDESLPNQSHLIRDLSSSQTITLSVTGVSGGSTGIYASWNVWSDPTASPAYQFGVGGSQSLGIQAAGVDIDTDSNNDGTIDHLTDDPIEEQDPGKVLAVSTEGSVSLAQAIVRPTGIEPMAAGEVIGELKATGDIRVWADAGRSTLLVSSGGSATFDLYSDTVPSTVYVEGLAVGTGELEWKVTVNGQSVGDDKVKFTVIELDSLTVNQHDDSNNTVTVTDSTPKNMIVWEDSKGNVGLDIKAMFEPGNVGKYVYWGIEQGGAILKYGNFANEDSIPDQKFNVANGRNINVLVWLGGEADVNEKKLQVSVTAPDTHEDFIYPFAWTQGQANPDKPAIISSIKTTNNKNKLQILVKKGEGYDQVSQGHSLLDVFKGIGTDQDSGQVAIIWKNNNHEGWNNNDVRETNAVQVPISMSHRKDGAAKWDQNGDGISWEVQIPADAVYVKIILIYTDILEGNYTQNSSSGRGDMPAIVGSWEGTKDADGNWSFTMNTGDITTTNGNAPGEGMKNDKVSSIGGILNGMGFNLNERRKNSSTYDTGYDIWSKPNQ